MQALTPTNQAPKQAIKTGSGATKDDPIDIDACQHGSVAQAVNKPKSHITPEMINKIN